MLGMQRIRIMAISIVLAITAAIKLINQKETGKNHRIIQGPMRICGQYQTRPRSSMIILKRIFGG